MKRILSGLLAAGLLLPLGSAPAQALSFDQNITPDVIFGSGNANGYWTVHQQNGVELGLRAKLRFDENNLPQNTFNSGGDGRYYFSPGSPTGGAGWVGPTTPIWNFEWAINTDYSDGESTGWKLNDLLYQLDIDFDPGAGQNLLSFDPINLAFADHAIGDNTTGNGGGATAEDASDYAFLIDTFNVAQNSWNMEFFNDAPFDTFDPNASGVYTFTLSAFYGDYENQIAGTQMEVVIGDIPEPGSIAIWLGMAGMLGMLGLRRRRNGR